MTTMYKIIQHTGEIKKDLIHILLMDIGAL